VGNDVHIAWNFSDLTRCEKRYKIPTGVGYTKYDQYLMCLTIVAESLVAIGRCRSIALGSLPEWDQWLEGYQPERAKLCDFAKSLWSKQNHESTS
jgi:hypothetical protein